MAENPDHFFQHRESSNSYYDAVPAIVEEYMNEISKITGRKYGLFDYYGAEDAERVIIAMGSVTEAAREAIDYLTAKGEKVGLVSVHLYRPFSAKHFLAAVPKTAKRCFGPYKRTGCSRRTSVSGCKRLFLWPGRCSGYRRRPLWFGV